MPETRNYDRFTITPVVTDADGQIRPVSPGSHTAWSIAGLDAEGEYHIGVHSVDELCVILTDLLVEHEETSLGIQATYLDEGGAWRRTGVGSPMSVCDELMETVIDETPDDAENTDDHPLEELRSIMIDVDDLIRYRRTGPLGP